MTKKTAITLPQTDQSRYVDDLTFIARFPRTATDIHHQEVQDLCASRFAELGFSVERFDYGDGVNVIGTLTGTERPDEIVLVSAHYDTIANGNGADDNASGVAAVLESARLLSTAKHKRTLLVACWDQEEPALTGSYLFVDRAKKTGMQIQVAYVFDEIGFASDQKDTQTFPAGFEVKYPTQALKARQNQNRANFILLICDQKASQWVKVIENAADQEHLPTIQIAVNLDQNVPGALKDSDHQSFWGKGYPAIEITDTAEYRNPYQHTNMDTVSTLNHDFAVKVITAVVASVETAVNP